MAGQCTPGAANNPVPALQGFVKSARASVECVNQACREVSESQRLQAVLRAVLATGNALNTGTPRANAEGIKLESLLKIADVKVRLGGLSHWGQKAALTRQSFPGRLCSCTLL